MSKRSNTTEADSINRGRKPKIPREEWAAILDAYETGAKQSDLAARYGVSTATISQTIKRANAEKPPSLTEEETVQPTTETSSTQSASTDPILEDLTARLLASAQESVDAIQTQFDEPTLASALHPLRRAMAALEIEAAKRRNHPNRARRHDDRDAHSADGHRLSEENTGAVKFYKKDSGFGFIVPDDGGEDIYFRSEAATNIPAASLKKGQLVRYALTEGKRGMEARSMVLL